MFALRFAAALAVLSSAGCQTWSSAEEPLPPGAQARSLLGEALFTPPMPEPARAEADAALAAARSAAAAAPEDADLLIAWGRRTAAAGQFAEAAEIFARGVERFPDDARMYRHRGHRLISLRRFAEAVPILRRAAELAAGHPDLPEPGLKPNARGVAIDTLKQNIWYHLGLAHYLLGDFEAALHAYRECERFSTNPDALCSVSCWLYATLCQLDRSDEAARVLQPITPELEAIEYRSYRDLLRIYRGELDGAAAWRAADPAGTDFATIAYGYGNHLLARGDEDGARAVLEAAATTEQWAAFGRIAAEAELLRRGWTPAETSTKP